MFTKLSTDYKQKKKKFKFKINLINKMSRTSTK